MPFERAQMVTKYFASFCNKCYNKELSNIAQSGHTDRSQQSLWLSDAAPSSSSSSFLFFFFSCRGARFQRSICSTSSDTSNTLRSSFPRFGIFNVCRSVGMFIFSLSLSLLISNTCRLLGTYLPHSLGTYVHHSLGTFMCHSWSTYACHSIGNLRIPFKKVPKCV